MKVYQSNSLLFLLRVSIIIALTNYLVMIVFGSNIFAEYIWGLVSGTAGDRSQVYIDIPTKINHSAIIIPFQVILLIVSSFVIYIYRVAFRKKINFRNIMLCMDSNEFWITVIFQWIMLAVLLVISGRSFFLPPEAFDPNQTVVVASNPWSGVLIFGFPILISFIFWRWVEAKFPYGK